jgi:acetyl esterase/lipase
MKYFLTFAALLLSLCSLRAADDLREPVTSWMYPPEMPGARIETYRRVGEVNLNAWIFEPTGHQAADRRPAVVFFFGGGWKSGTPGQFLPHCLHLAQTGLVAITVDYRVKDRHDVFPQECVRDAKSAIRWVRTNAKRLGIDPDRIAAGGGSAGGHLAAATALVPGFDDGETINDKVGDNTIAVSSMPNALILFNPAVVLAPVADHPDLMPADKFADIHERANGRPQEISPYHFVRAGLPPCIIFHGTNDEAVPFSTVQLFEKAMTAAGNHCELKAYPGQPHGFFNPGRGKDERRAEGTRNYYKTLSEIDAFLAKLGV